MLGDGHRVEARHVGHPHPCAGGCVKVDVVDPDSELLDEPEAPRPDSPAGQRRPHRDDHVNGRPAIDQPRFEPGPARRPRSRRDQQRGKASAAASPTRRDSRRTAPCRQAPGEAPRGAGIERPSRLQRDPWPKRRRHRQCRFPNRPPHSRATRRCYYVPSSFRLLCRRSEPWPSVATVAYGAGSATGSPLTRLCPGRWLRGIRIVTAPSGEVAWLDGAFQQDPPTAARGWQLPAPGGFQRLGPRRECQQTALRRRRLPQWQDRGVRLCLLVG